MNKLLKKVLSTTTAMVLLASLSSQAFASTIDFKDAATPAALPDTLPSLNQSATAGTVKPMASNSRTVKTDTGGTLTSNTWLSSLHSNGLIDYQVSAQYNKTDHTNIRTEWYATIGAVSTTKTASVTLSTSSGSVTATTSSTTTTSKTASKYYENTKSQKDASYKSNLAVQGDWEFVTLTNNASVWGGKVVKKAQINSQATVRK